MVQVLDGVRDKQLPEAALVCNFPKPAGDDAGLMEYGDVVTFFHEFGHLMHWILGGHQAWAGISGITMESDFVEAPSQMLEEWLRSPQVLAKFARHYQTGEAMPVELVARMNRASAFGRGSWVSAQNTYTAISYDIYKGRPQDVDLDTVTMENVKRYSHTVPLPGTHFYASFGHLAGYSSGVLHLPLGQSHRGGFLPAIRFLQPPGRYTPLCDTGARCWNRAAPCPPTTW